MSADRWRISVRWKPDEVARLIGPDAGLRRTPFQDAGWLAAWRHSLGAEPGVELVVAEIADGTTGAPAFVLPLIRETRRGIVRLSAWDRGVADYNGPLVAPDFPPEMLRQLWPRLVAALPAADVLMFEKSPGRIGGAVNPLTLLDGLIPSIFSGHPLRLSPDYERMAAERFDGSTRRSLAKKRRKLQAKGRLEFRIEEGPAVLDGLVRVLEWRSRRFPTAAETAADGRAWAFYRRLAAETGVVRVATLTLDGVPISGCFGTLVGTSFQLIAVGHEARWDNWSAGLLAIESSVAWACGAGIETYDFTVGEEPYKRTFGVESMPLWELRVPLGIKGRLVLLALSLRTRLKRLRDEWRARRQRRRASETAAP
ncbi:GNAT family N-acetyltransferase [Siculibacillus lacustris]|nr:GNAT family N-acetyltransferase [Siculibacillus lacustris]